MIFAPLLCAWGLGLGAILGSADVAALAIGVWLITVVGCSLLELVVSAARRSGCCAVSRTDGLRIPDRLCEDAPSAGALRAL